MISYLDVFVNPGETKLFTIPKGSLVRVDIEYHIRGDHYVHVVNNPIYGNDPTRLDNSMICLIHFNNYIIYLMLVYF